MTMAKKGLYRRMTSGELAAYETRVMVAADAKLPAAKKTKKKRAKKKIAAKKAARRS